MAIQAAYAMMIGAGLYGYGETFDAALADLRAQTSGGGRYGWSVQAKATALPLDADQASECAECMDADVLAWL